MVKRGHPANSDARVMAYQSNSWQEVDLEWAGKLHSFFAEKGYAAVFAQYGKSTQGSFVKTIEWC